MPPPRRTPPVPADTSAPAPGTSPAPSRGPVPPDIPTATPTPPSASPRSASLASRGPVPRNISAHRATAALLLALAACDPPSSAPTGPVPPASPTPAPVASPPVPADSPTTASAPAPAVSPAPAAPVREDLPARTPPPGLVDLRARLPDLCFDIRYHTADNFTGAPLPGYGAPGAWLRERPAAALARAQAELAPRGLVLLIHDAYRPIRASRAMVDWAERTGRVHLVDGGYIARRSHHNRGDTVDITLARPGTCAPLDMGSPWDHLGPESHTLNAAGEALANRLLLRDTLAAVGFVPYPKEWWHFTFHDEGAVPLDIPYGPADPP